MDWTFELLAGPYGCTTEGPAWDGQALLFTHIPGSRIMRYDPHTGACTEFRTGTHGTNGLMFDAQGRLYGCQSGQHCITRVEPDGDMTPLPNRLDGRRHNRPNDLAIDRKGRIWFTDPFGRGRPAEERELDHASVLRRHRHFHEPLQSRTIAAVGEHALLPRHAHKLDQIGNEGPRFLTADVLRQSGADTLTELDLPGEDRHRAVRIDPKPRVEHAVAVEAARELSRTVLRQNQTRGEREADDESARSEKVAPGYRRRAHARVPSRPGSSARSSWAARRTARTMRLCEAQRQR